jgi:type VI secretion system protein ImpJ
MRNPPVDWSEGMFLRPQHFQAADRYWSEALSTSERWDHPFNYGLRRLEISQEALLNYQLQVVSCEARLRDGTLVSLGLGEEPDRIDLRPQMDQINQSLKRLQTDLRDSFQKHSTLQVFLAVPKLKLGNRNVADAKTEAPHRFNKVLYTLQDEGTGGNDQEIALRAVNVRLLLSTENQAGYECLPIAEIQRAGEQDATPRINVRYIPPVIAIDAWPELQLNIVRAIYDIVGNRIEGLGEKVRNRGLVIQEPHDADRLLRLTALNEAFATLGVLAFAQGVHPFDAYTELCRLVGKLAILDPTRRRAPEVPRYNHDDLAGIFYWVYQQIKDLIDTEPQEEYKQRWFELAGQQMQVTLDPVWLNTDWQWYVGVARGDVSEQECRELLGPGHLHWKLGSVRQVEIIFQQRREGLHLVPLVHTPRALPGRGWVYYEVSRQNEAWRDVQETQTLAMRLAQDLIVKNAQTDNRRRLTVKPRNKNTYVTLEFALFAVRGAP